LTTLINSVVIKATLLDKQTIKFNGFSRRARTRPPDVRLMKTHSAAGKNNSIPVPSVSLKIIICFLCVVFMPGFRCLAQDSQPSEYQIKAAFVYNFAKFVAWPTQTFAMPTSPMIIGVLGKNVFGGELKKTIQGNAINGHPLQFREFHSVMEATNCQVLFISPSEKNDFPKILAEMHEASVLTVSETDNFIKDGGMINLIIVDRKVRFQINNKAAQKVGLTISSKLLSLGI
jgi:YfiR/HmsC-like